mmetsp:Transcript_30004/g.41544  ORF Transcript_30004/g.41544 Transcript_30004/m.41544 type:complete len:283 (-) Transcript_30004:1187-2035(-)
MNRSAFPLLLRRVNSGSSTCISPGTSIGTCSRNICQIITGFASCVWLGSHLSTNNSINSRSRSHLSHSIIDTSFHCRRHVSTSANVRGHFSNGFSTIINYSIGSNSPPSRSFGCCCSTLATIFGSDHRGNSNLGSAFSASILSSSGFSLSVLLRTHPNRTSKTLHKSFQTSSFRLFLIPFNICSALRNTGSGGFCTLSCGLGIHSGVFSLFTTQSFIDSLNSSFWLVFPSLFGSFLRSLRNSLWLLGSCHAYSVGNVSDNSTNPACLLFSFVGSFCLFSTCH